MLWLFKWTIIFLFVGGAWFSYDFVTRLSPDERQKLRTELVGAIDGDPAHNLGGPMVQKAKDDFVNGLKTQFKNVVHKILD